MATSTIPAFKAALVARLDADPDLSGVQVCYGLPFPRPIERESVLVLGTRSDDPTGGSGGGQRSAAMGQQRREERYVLEVVVSVLRKARDAQQGTTERAFEIAAVIEESLRSWTSDPAKPVRWALVTSVSHDEPANQDEREAEVRIDVACSARI